MKLRASLAIFCVAISNLVFSASAEVQTTFVDKDEKTVEARGTILGNGQQCITVGLRNWNLLSLKVDGQSAKSISYDPMTGLILASLSEAVDGAETMVLGSSLDLQPGTSLDAGEQAAAFAGWQTEIQGVIQPLALMRVRFEESVPPIGTAVTDGDGKVVGFVFEAVAQRSAEAYALPVEAASRLVKNFDKAGAAQRAWIGVSLEYDNSCPEITGLRNGSPGEVAGLEKGDIILAIGDRSIHTFNDAVDAFYFMVPGQGLEITVLRGTMVLNFEVEPAVHPIQGA